MVRLALLLAVCAGPVHAYDRWSINDDATNCGECHGDFRSNTYISPVDGMLWGNLHEIHRSTMLNGDCETCHLASDEFPVLLDESGGGSGFDPISCTGCHNGPGLRLHHLNASVPPDSNGDTCASAGCHTSDPTPPSESVIPPYYFTPDGAHPNKPTDPCNPSPDFPENFAGLTIAVDNDGDLMYDGADTDCTAAETLFCFSFDNFCDGIEILSVLPDKTVEGTWNNFDCGGSDAPMLGGYSGKNVSPRLSWLAADSLANLDISSFNLNVDAKTFDLFEHDTLGNLTQLRFDEPYSVTPGACAFSPEKAGLPASIDW
jgi:hypothetical protein